MPGRPASSTRVSPAFAATSTKRKRGAAGAAAARREAAAAEHEPRGATRAARTPSRPGLTWPGLSSSATTASTFFHSASRASALGARAIWPKARDESRSLPWPRGSR